ncbi:asparaginyl-tRNA synthetase [Pyricularia oryzae]|nr:asparaginyl-tRNA synthetase [Pyricularia oryzae]KAI7911739.1 asparaginyl-tRNA synthetase [Pyricularia oryzae]
MRLLCLLHPRIMDGLTIFGTFPGLRERSAPRQPTSFQDEGNSPTRPLEPSDLLPTLYDGATICCQRSCSRTGEIWGLLAAYHILGDVGWADWT